MKKKPSEQTASTPGASALKKITIMGLIVKGSFISCVIATLLLFAGVADLGIFDLTPVLSGFNAAFLALQLLSSILCAYAISQISSANKELTHQQSEDLKEKYEARVDLVEGKVEEFLGENYKQLKEQNETMKTEFDQIRENENNKIIAEIEELKIENAELRKKLAGNSNIIEEIEEPENQLQVA